MERGRPRPIPHNFCATTRSEHGAKGRLECGDWSPLWKSSCWPDQAACCLEYHKPISGRAHRRVDIKGRQAASCGSRSTRESGDESPHSKRPSRAEYVRPEQKLCGIGRPRPRSTADRILSTSSIPAAMIRDSQSIEYGSRAHLLWQPDCAPGAALGPVGHIRVAAQPFHDLARDRQARTRAFGLGGRERLKHFLRIATFISVSIQEYKDKGKRKAWKSKEALGQAGKCPFLNQFWLKIRIEQVRGRSSSAGGPQTSADFIG